MAEESKENLHLGRRLRSLRLSKERKLKEVAQAIGVTEGYLSRIELGHSHGFSGEIANRLTSYYGVSEKWLLTGVEDDPVKLAAADYYKAIEDSGLRAEAETLLQQTATWLDFVIVSPASAGNQARTEVLAALDHFLEVCARGNQNVLEAGKKLAEAYFHDANLSKSFDKKRPIGDAVSVMHKWKSLKQRLEALTSGRGSQVELAKAIGISRQSVHQYLSGASAPSAEITLRLLEWVVAEEQKQKSPEGAATPSEPKTRKRNINEKPNSGPF